jgi:hypothetical protein
VGDRLTVTVIDTVNYAGTYNDAGSPGTCGFGLDITKGETLMVTAVANENDKIDYCTVPDVDVAPFNGWTWTLDTSMSLGANNIDVVEGTYRASKGSCMGTATIDVFLTSQGGDPFATYVPGKDAGVVMGRVFTGSGAAGCPTSCSDYYIVNVKRA